MLKLGVNGTITDQYLQDLANQVDWVSSYNATFILVCRVETVSDAIIAFMQKNHFKSNS
ncbi:MAG: hypothetical protein ACRD5J_06240 [Nitrososphaeraceae archaeon]